jgi:protein O-GlcNAc transferase
MTPWMHETEVALILKHLYYTDVMLEWGSGGSTTYFPHFVKDYYSIEHDTEWAERVKAQAPDNVQYHHVPWDAPRTIPTQRSQFETYIKHVDTLGVSKFDKVLIDGRARGWCAEYVLPYLHKDSIIFIHDFWNRPQYHVVFEWYTEVASVKGGNLQTIVALQPKPEFITG